MERASKVSRGGLFVLVVTTLMSIAVAVSSAAEHTKDTLAEVKKNLDGKKAVLLDVREQREWDSGHLAWATLLPLSELRKHADSKDFADELSEKLSKEKIIYCHCRSGGRVLPASEILNQLGYDVRPLKAGYQKLLEAGFPKAKSERK